MTAGSAAKTASNGGAPGPWWRTVQPLPDRWARWLVVALAAAVPLGSATSNILSAALLLAWLAAGGFVERWQRIRVYPFALASLGLWLLILTGALWSSSPWGESWRNIEKYARLLLVPIVISLIVDERWRRRALLAWMVAMLLTLALSYLHAFWAFPLARATRDGALGDHYIFKHHITQNVMMSVFAVAALAEAVRRWVRQPDLAWWREPVALAWFALALLAAFNVLVLVQGRTGYVTLFANMGVAALILLRLKRAKLLAPVLLIVLAASAVSSEALRERTREAVAEASAAREGASLTSIGRRAEFIERSWALIRERPLLGWGTGAYAEQFCRVARSPEWCAVGYYNPHNQFVFIGVQLGLVGLAALLIWLVAALASLWRLEPTERLVGLALVVSFVIHAMLDSPLYIATESVWYPLHLALASALAWRSDRTGDQGSDSKAIASSSTRSTDGHSGQD
ncbi:MAG: O-antigen ligase family protein [Casimicrobiaceae bacterium]